MIAVLDLEALLADLRRRGIDVGWYEYDRLRKVFAAEPDLREEHLRSLLRCTLIKDGRQIGELENAISLWLGRAESVLDAPEEEEPSPVRRMRQVERVLANQPSLPALEPSPVRRRWIAWIVSGVILICAVLLAWYLSRPKPPAPEPSKPVTNEKPSPDSQHRDSSDVGEIQLVEKIDVPTLEVSSVEPRRALPTGWTWLSCAALAAMVGAISALLFWVRSKRVEVPKLDPKEVRRGRAPLLHIEAGSEELIDREAARGMVWGVERFVADEHTERLDLARTVDATARAAGFITLHHERPFHDRTVWLWRDTLPSEPEVARLAREAESALRRGGLPARSGYFYGVPDGLRWSDDDSQFSPLTVEGQRESVIVAILTDGRGIENALGDHRRRASLLELLRSLRAWPRLTFVAMGSHREAMIAVAKEHALPCIGPEELPRFLEGAERDSQPPAKIAAMKRELRGELRFWAAALALPMQPFDEETAWAVRDALDLHCDRLDVEVLRENAHEIGLRWQFDGSLSAELIDWLGRAERHRDGSRPFRVDESSMLGRVLAFWRERNLREQETEQALREDLSALPAAIGALELQAAVLDLWDCPAVAAANLDALSSLGLAEAIRARVRFLVPMRPRSEELGSDAICLPWTTDDISIDTLVKLAELGLSEAIPALRRRPPIPMALRLILVSIATLALGSVMGGILAPHAPSARTSPYVEHGARPDSANLSRTDDVSSAVLDFSAPKNTGSIDLHPGALTDVEWKETERPNPEKLEGGVELWRAGRVPRPTRPDIPGWPPVTILCLPFDVPPGESGWRSWMHQMLDAGVVDVAYVGPSAIEAMKRATWPFGQAQIIVVTPEALEPPTAHAVAMVEATDPMQLPVPANEESRLLSDLWPDAGPEMKRAPDAEPSGRFPVTRLTGDPVRLARGALLDLVSIPAGTFRLGSPTEEEGHGDNEGPIEGVRVAAFEICRTEVTRGQWRAVMPKDRCPKEWGSSAADDALPANYVRWGDALDFCNALSDRAGLDRAYTVEWAGDRSNANTDLKSIAWNREADGYRLPTEAEWEYAARAGTDTPHPWKEGEAGLDDHAWWYGNSKDANDARPVATKPPNAWGLHDMIGNVREWCWDAYDDKHDPKGRDGAAGDDRVVRGGSFGFYFGSWNLRSAYRSRDSPSRRLDFVGFRCVRAPRRQPSTH